MAHFHIEYSPNLESRLDISALCRAVRDAAAETGVFPVAGLRVRAFACDHMAMANDDPQHAFLDLEARLRGGRSAEDKKRATNHVFAAAETFCSDVLATSSLMLSFEMRDIDPDLSPKTSSIRNYLPEDLT